MSSFGDVIRSFVASATRRSARDSHAASQPSVATETRTAALDANEPGRHGDSATVEVEPASVSGVRMTYVPSTDGDPDPGEIVWTWVPYEERDGRGKDRPVLVVAAETGGTYLAVQLTSKPHQNNVEFVPIGSGNWDAAGRPSWVNIDRVFRLHPGGMRRETAGLPALSFSVVEAALRRRYGWR